MITSSSTGDPPDQLSAYEYETSAGDFVRFRPNANDDAVSVIVRSATVAGSQRSEEFRHSLSDEGTNTLRLFAMRRTLQARRGASMSLLGESIDAYALLPKPKDVPWDSWFKGTLFVSRSLGLEPATLGERFADSASSEAVEHCQVAIEAMSRVDTLSQCQLVEVTTTYGTGFLELLVFDFMVKAGWLGTRHLAVNEISYQPTTNLAQVAASLADALDASGRLVTGPIGQDQLAATAFSLSVPGSYLPTAGCLSFIAEGVDGGPSFSVFVAEMTDETDISSLAANATEVGNQAAIYDARRLIVISAQPNFDEANDADTDVDFHDYESLALAALQESTNSQWQPR
jgi:hypothetical protein